MRSYWLFSIVKKPPISDNRADYQALEKLNAEEIGRLFPIVIKEYNPDWALSYKKKKSELIRILGDSILRVEHIGSTAIPTIQSKPIIDVLVEVPDDAETKETIRKKMKAYGYHYTLRTDRKPPHMMFIMGYTKAGFSGEVFHIHMAEKENESLWDRVCFRDYLIANVELAKEYETLKLRLSREFRHNREAYTEGKSEFVREVTEMAKYSLRHPNK